MGAEDTDSRFTKKEICDLSTSFSIYLDFASLSESKLRTKFGMKLLPLVDFDLIIVETFSIYLIRFNVVTSRRSVPWGEKKRTESS